MLKEYVIVHIPEDEMEEGERYMLPILVRDGNRSLVQFFDKKYYKILGLTDNGLFIVALPVWLFSVNYLSETEMIHYKIQGRRWM